MQDAVTASIILVSGAPGTGKTTVARELARLLRFPLLSKDVFKESLHDSFGTTLAASLDGESRTSQEISRLLSKAAMELLWATAPDCLQVILEANFRPQSDYERGRISALPGRKLEVYCHCTPAEAARRFAERAAVTRDHPAHSMKAISAEMLMEYDRAIGLCPVIDVDTGSEVSAVEIVRRIREHWPDLAQR